MLKIIRYFMISIPLRLPAPYKGWLPSNNLSGITEGEGGGRRSLPGSSTSESVCQTDVSGVMH